MDYAYRGEAADAFAAAYRADEPPFPTDPDMSFPERVDRCEEVRYLRQLFFPRCWNAEGHLRDAAAIRDCLSELGRLFTMGLRPYSDSDPTPIVDEVLDRLPGIREQLTQDVTAAYKGDPAAKTHLEIIRSYPGLLAILVQRVAHAFYQAGADQYARELTEYAKTETGIDIHPGAEIGSHFFIDHGTGVVIGETATVGDWVRIYQDVTLGALHFEEEEDEEHMLKKGYKRHPDVGDHVVIGAGTKLLGPISIGDHVSIGANSWVTDDVPDNTEVVVADHPDQERKSTD
jgi:serine O-acetyltransferase